MQEEIPDFRKSTFNYRPLLVIVPTLIGMLIGGILPILCGFGAGLYFRYLSKL
jgi:hypothetical protein